MTLAFGRIQFVDKQGRFHKHDFEERVLGPAIGDGLLTARGDHWRWQRRAAPTRSR